MPEKTVEFYDSEAGQFAIGAQQYLMASTILMRSAEFRQRPTLLFRPISQNCAQGVELLLKYPLARAGLTGKQIAQAFGHQLMELWTSPVVAPIKPHLYRYAEEAWNEARGSGDWPDTFEEDPVAALEEMVGVLAHLHSSQTNWVLRYPGDFNKRAPRPWLMVTAFQQVAERVVMNPSFLEL
jgi:hypothetical protein